jgi:topoisomerase-4 subunit A
VIAVASVRQGGELTIFSGKQHLTLSWRDLQAYEGTRATRGNALPRGYTRVDAMSST